MLHAVVRIPRHHGDRLHQGEKVAYAIPERPDLARLLRNALES